MGFNYTINSAFLINYTKHQEGWRKGGAHCLDMDKLVRRARSLALAKSYTHKLCRLFSKVFETVSIHGKVAYYVASIVHSSGCNYSTYGPLYI